MRDHLAFSNFIGFARRTFENNSVLGELASFDLSVLVRLTTSQEGWVLRVKAPTGLTKGQVVDIKEVELEFRFFDMFMAAHVAGVPETQVDALGVPPEVLGPLELLGAILTLVLLGGLVFVVVDLPEVPGELALGREGLRTFRTCIAALLTILS